MRVREKGSCGGVREGGGRGGGEGVIGFYGECY